MSNNRENRELPYATERTHHCWLIKIVIGFAPTPQTALVKNKAGQCANQK